MVCYVEYVIKLWSYTASHSLIIILGRFMEIVRPILNLRLPLVIWVIWDTSGLFLEQKTSSMCFLTEIRILFVYLEDSSGPLTSNLRRKRSIVRVDYLSKNSPNGWWWARCSGQIRSPDSLWLGQSVVQRLPFQGRVHELQSSKSLRLDCGTVT
jgi:hypothetical protein